MPQNGWYYFHRETKDLIWKKFEPEIDSPFVQRVWSVDTSDRKDAWTILLEALSMGLKINRAKELAEKWKMDQKDFEEMLLRVHPNEEMKSGAHIFIKEILGLVPDDYWDDLEKRGSVN